MIYQTGSGPPDGRPLPYFRHLLSRRVLSLPDATTAPGGSKSKDKSRGGANTTYHLSVSDLKTDGSDLFRSTSTSSSTHYQADPLNSDIDCNIEQPGCANSPAVDENLEALKTLDCTDTTQIVIPTQYSAIEDR